MAAEQAAWTETPLLKELGRSNDAARNLLRQLPQRWAALRGQFQNLHQQFSERPDAISQHIRSHVAQNPVIRLDSVAGEAITSIAAEFGLEEAAGAAQFALAQPVEQVFSSLSKARSKGVLDFWSRVSGTSKKGAGTVRDAMRRTAREHEERLAGHLAHLEEVERAHEQKFTDFVADLEAQKREFAGWRESTEGQVAKQRHDWESAWDDLKKLFEEQLQLRAAVSQWNARASEHRRAFRAQRKWTIGVGVAGVVLLAVWAFASLEFAQWLFADAFTVGDQPPRPGTVRPTWQNELIMASLPHAALSDHVPVADADLGPDHDDGSSPRDRRQSACVDGSYLFGVGRKGCSFGYRSGYRASSSIQAGVGWPRER